MTYINDKYDKSKENDENNTKILRNYKNISHNIKNTTNVLNDIDNFEKILNKKTNIANINNDIKTKSIFEKLNLIDNIEDDEDDEDYEIDEEEEEEDEDDDFDIEEYETEDNDENEFYNEKIYESDYENERMKVYKNKNILNKDLDKYDLSNLSYTINSINDNNYYNENVHENTEQTKNDYDINERNIENNYETYENYHNEYIDDVQNENDEELQVDILDRIEEIYYKNSKYKNLKEVNNKNNNICVNDLNLSLISDYLNVDISMFHKKTTVLLLGNQQSGKSSFINWYSENYVQNTNSIQKNNEITYVDIKSNYKFNLKKLQDEKYQFGLMNKDIILDENKKYIFTGENCFSLFKPFEKIKNTTKQFKKYIYAKICYQNNFIKYMNRINTVSFIDTNGINSFEDKEYDDIIMNLCKYVDLIFIFIDSNQFVINGRLLRIMNYIMDYQIKKVSLCLTRIDMIKKVNLYRVIFYLTQYFLKNLNIFKYNLLNYMGNEDDEEMNIENEQPADNQFYKDIIRKNDHFEGYYQGKINRSIKSFMNVILFPKLITKALNKNNLNKSNINDIKNNQKNYLYNFENKRNSIKNTKNEENLKSSNNIGVGGIILKKIMTKKYNSFKEKVFDNNILKKLNNSKNTEEEGIIEEIPKMITRRMSYFFGNDEKNEINEEKRISKNYSSKESNFNKYNRYSSNFNNINKYDNHDQNHYINEYNENNINEHDEKNNEQNINYIDCIKNLLIFIFVLTLGIVTKLYKVFYTQITNYFNQEINIMDKDYSENVENESLEKVNSTYNTEHVLEFLTIYLPEIPRNALKLEKWKYDPNNNNNINKKRYRYSCNVNYENNIDLDYENKKHKIHFKRTSIPIDLLMNENKKNDINKRNINESMNYINSLKKNGELIKSNIHKNKYSSLKDEKFINKEYEKNVSLPINKNNPFNIHSNRRTSIRLAENINTYKPNYTNVNEKDNSILDKYNNKKTTRFSGPYENIYEKINYKENRNSIKNMNLKTQYINKSNEYDYEKYYLKNKEHNNSYINKQNNSYISYNDNIFDENDLYNIHQQKNNMYRQEEINDINMIQELLFKIDEGIDIKTNESIYMLKKDLQKIQNNCLKRISDNNEIIKKNKSVRIQKIKFYLFKYLAIIIGSFISILRYDLLVYFNFINSELILGLLSKYFIFLSTYNKNCLFILANIVLLLSYSFLYFRYKKNNYFKSLDKSDLNKLKIILLFTQIIFDEINQLHKKLLGKSDKNR